MDGTLERKRTRGRPRAGGAQKPPGTVQALQRALVLLNALARADKASLTELALNTGMPPSSAHRLLTTLQSHGYVDFDEATNLWMVGIEAFRAGNSFLRRMNVVDAARDVMRGLVEATGETANLALPDGGEVVFVSQIESSNPVRAFFSAGTRTPMHASGMGKALMARMDRSAVEALLQATGLPGFTEKTHMSAAGLFADLERVRARGWALDDEERHPGMRCVAAAVVNAHGLGVAGISVSGPSARLGEEAVAAFGPLVKRAAGRVSERLGA